MSPERGAASEPEGGRTDTSIDRDGGGEKIPTRTTHRAEKWNEKLDVVLPFRPAPSPADCGTPRGRSACSSRHARPRPGGGRGGTAGGGRTASPSPGYGGAGRASPPPLPPPSSRGTHTRVLRRGGRGRGATGGAAARVPRSRRAERRGRARAGRERGRTHGGRAAGGGVRRPRRATSGRRTRPGPCRCGAPGARQDAGDGVGGVARVGSDDHRGRGPSSTTKKGGATTGRGRRRRSAEHTFSWQIAK